MIDRSHGLPIASQAKALNISRSGVYYRPRAVPAADLAIMRRMDELHLDFPFAGGRMLRDLLNAEGVAIGRRHVATLMKRMGIEAIYRRPDTSKPAPGHKIYPYLLRDLPVTGPDQVWAMDITYVPMARGFVYLAAAIDWSSRRVLAWRLSITIAQRSPGGMSAEPTGRRRSASRRWKRPWPATAGRRSSTPIRAASSPARPSPACWPRTRSPSAWTARVPGATTSSSRGSGDRSSTRRSTSELTTRSPRPAPRSAGTSTSTTPEDRIRALTGGRRIKPTSLACRRSRRPEPGRHSTYQAGKPVQTNRASSVLPWGSSRVAVASRYANTTGGPVCRDAAGP